MKNETLIPRCDSCGSERSARILYGRIAETPQLRKDMAAGKVILGGCILHENSPQRKCLDCGKMWPDEIKKDPGESAGVFFDRFIGF